MKKMPLAHSYESLSPSVIAPKVSLENNKSIQMSNFQANQSILYPMHCSTSSFSNPKSYFTELP